MLYAVENKSTRPEYNLALEEYLCGLVAEQNKDYEFFMLWQNEPSVIIGRFQDAQAEVNEDFVREQGIHVVRRNSGGGAVYHDFGNVNYSFITRDRFTGLMGPTESFIYFTRPILDALRNLGVSVELSGRNDIIATGNGRKISGGAEWRHNGILLYHGTLLFDSDLDVLTRALTPAPDKISFTDNANSDNAVRKVKKVKSIRSRVTNIKPLLESQGIKITLKDFMAYISGRIGGERFTLTDFDEREIQRLMDEKYSRPEWTWEK